ncbi:aromatase/cyclase [Streptomyces sp. OR43]|uniref:aromatase/cyclase n=1 Tax=Streptomyces sp. or43 TaxID=2478957 RepID=UPI0011CDF864|nr:aromatase/cyclase [Streptomyces sp. or43]TXS39160.1 cyclase [Streptomyces sp. or43]
MHTTRVIHRIDVPAPASVIYDIIADVGSWPLYFPPTVRAERVSGDASDEYIRIWALANGELRTWISRRRLDRSALRIEFTQTEPRPPVAEMGGTWQIEERGEGTCQVSLEHSYRATEDDPANLERIARAVDTNSQSELDALRAAAERHGNEHEVLVAFEDSDTVTGSLEDVYDFVYDLARWPNRIPHVLRMEVTENVHGLQYMEMDTKSPDGSVHTTQSGRVCVEPESIVYKQTRLPGLLLAHTGEWAFEAVGEGRVRVISRHRVILDVDALAALPVPPASPAEARTAVRNALGANSRATITAAQAYAAAGGSAGRR